MKCKWIACALLVFAGGLGVARSSTPQSPLGAIRDELSAVAHQRIPLADRAARLNAIFDTHVDELTIPLTGLSDADLREVLGSLDILAAHSSISGSERNLGYTQGLLRAFEELRRRSLASAGDFSTVYGALVAAREFDKARSLMDGAPTELHSFLPRIVRPAGFDEREPSELTWVPSDSVLVLRNVDLRLRNRIIVVGGCHIGRSAIVDITSDPRLNAAFLAGNALWLEPAGRELDLAAIERWKAEFPEFPMHIAYRHADWRGIDFSRSPSFYFFRDGKLIASHQGWLDGQVPKPVEEALQQMQLL